MAPTDVQEPSIAEAQQTPTEVTFFAKSYNLVLTAFQALDNYTATGIRRPEAPGFRFEFQENRLVIDDKLRAEFHDYLERYGNSYFVHTEAIEETQAAGPEGWLRSRPTFDTPAPDGFVELKVDVPSATPVVEAILDAALAGDMEALAAIQDAELAGYKRPQVLDPVRRALLRVQGIDPAEFGVTGEPPHEEEIQHG